MSQIDPQTEMFMGLFALIAIVDGYGSGFETGKNGKANF